MPGPLQRELISLLNLVIPVLWLIDSTRIVSFSIGNMIAKDYTKLIKICIYSGGFNAQFYLYSCRFTDHWRRSDRIHHPADYCQFASPRGPKYLVRERQGRTAGLSGTERSVVVGIAVQGEQGSDSTRYTGPLDEIKVLLA